MAQQRARCTNFGVCGRADSRQTIQIDVGEKAVCPECGQPILLMAPTGAGFPIGAALALVAALGMLGVAAYFGFRQFATKEPTPTLASQPPSSALPGTQVVAPDTPAPATPAIPTPNPVPATPPAPPTDPDAIAKLAADMPQAPAISSSLFMLYEKSAKEWLNLSINAINTASQDSGGRLTADYMGSREGMQNVLYGQFGNEDPSAPALWNPADLYWIRKANETWQRGDGKFLKGSNEPRLSEPVTILSTRLVFVMWSDRAVTFQNAMSSPRFRNRTWQLLSEIAINGWGSVGGDSSWGKLKLAQSNPLRSNSAIVALGLMYGEWSRTLPSNQTPSPANPQFVAFMRAIEDSVVGAKFEDTTSTALKSMLSAGPASYDVAIAYEQNAIRAADSDPRLRIVYPDPTAEVRFPLALLRGAAWMTPQKTQDAQAVADYLLEPSVQRKAIAFGFRPGLSTLRQAVADELNTESRSAYGFRMDAPIASSLGSTSTLDSLQDIWRRLYRPAG